MQPRKSRFSYEQLGQVILSPLQAAQNRFRQLKQRKSKTVTGVEHVGFAHISVASVDDSGIEDQNAAFVLEVD